MGQSDSSPGHGHHTPSQLLTEIISALQNHPGTDQQLLEVLTGTVVTLAPADTALIDALNQIEGLASKRSKDPENG